MKIDVQTFKISLSIKLFLKFYKSHILFKKQLALLSQVFQVQFALKRETLNVEN